MARKDNFFDKAKDAYGNAQERMTEIKENTIERIQDHPFASVAVAASVGAVVGIITFETIRMMKQRR